MKNPRISIHPISLFSMFFLVFLFSCGNEANEKEGQAEIDFTDTDEEGIRLIHFPSCEALGTAIQPWIKPGFQPSDYDDEIDHFADYFTSYGCSWIKITPLDPNPGEHREGITVEGSNSGWDINSEHEKTTKEEVLERYYDYEEIHDPRLEEVPYKDHIFVLKKRENKKGDWKFLAFIDPTHSIDGDGQWATFSSGFSPYRTPEKAEYELPSDEEAVSVFLKLVEPLSEAKD